MDPLEEAGDEDCSRYHSDEAEVEHSKVQIAVHAVVDRWECASRYKNVDSSVIEATEYFVDLCIRQHLLPDIG